MLAVFSFRYDINGKTKNREFCYRLMLVVFVLVSGLRWRIGIDTPAYCYSFYHEYPTLSEFSWRDYPVGEDPFFVLINSFVKTFGGRFYVVQIIHATIINVLIFHYIKKHSELIFTCLFFYAITCYTTYNMEIMRGSLSIVICLYANDFILDKKWIKGYLLYSLALMFHAQTIVLLVLPILYFLRFNKLGLVVFILSFFLGIILMRLLNDYLFLFEASESVSDKISGYSTSDMYGGQGGNINFYIVTIFPLLFYAVTSFIYVKYQNPSSSLLKFEPLIVIGVIFILIRMNLEIAYRYVDYYKLYFVLFFSEFYVGLIKKACLLTKSVALFRSCIVFVPYILFFLVYYYVLSDDYSLRYNPYSSVIDRTICNKRELMYKRLNAEKMFYPNANVNEY